MKETLLVLYGIVDEFCQEFLPLWEYLHWIKKAPFRYAVDCVVNTIEGFNVSTYFINVQIGHLIQITNNFSTFELGS